MKEPTAAPFYASLYAPLCEIARGLGYALAIHGSIVSDLDLIAVPWTNEATSAEDLMVAIKAKLKAMDYRELLTDECSWATGEEIDDMIDSERRRIGEPRGPLDCAIKPHGRKVWNLYLGNGCKVDLSVMPLNVSL